MAKPKKSAKETVKWKKKKWVKIIAPKTFKSAVLGESLVLSTQNLVGKTVESNLMTLTGDMKKQNINVKFRVNKITEGQAHTTFKSYKLIPSSVKRMIRRTRDRVDHSFLAKTKDGFTIRTKPLIITNSNTSNTVLTLIRKKTEALLSKHLAKISLDEFVSEVLNHKIQNELKKQVKDVYPIKICEMRAIEVIKEPEKQKASEEPAPSAENKSEGEAA
ncbi:MAG: hypothetical protein ACQESF_05595 [Nanobdellota archaeon]